MEKMSELRLDPTTGEWVIIAADRGSRPHEYSRRRSRKQVPYYLAGCPFCPGNEALTPPAVLEIPGSGGWRLRGFPNKFAALRPAASQERSSNGPLFTAIPGQGVHEVLVETPEHNGFPALREEEQIRLMVQAYQQRYLALQAQPWIQYVLVFKNQGEEAGTSLEHPHSQIIAAPVVPERVQRQGKIARNYFERVGQCLYCQLAQEELRLRIRLVYQDERFVVFHFFAAAHAAETWIVPLEHQASFGELDARGLAGLASILGRTLRQLRNGFGDPDFNYAIHSALGSGQGQPDSHWYLQLIPRLSKAAGFEIGSGMYINEAAPEGTAEVMRRAPFERAPQN
jgi:UDPglucose--hexose-1-phosphate uridylyltransferase